MAWGRARGPARNGTIASAMQSSTMDKMFPKLIYRLSIRSWHIRQAAGWPGIDPWLGAARLSPAMQKSAHAAQRREPL